MSQKNLPGLARPKGPIRRSVRKDYRVGDQIGYKTKSFTQADGTEYHPALDVVTGEWSCTCKAAQFRPHTPCKHTLRAAQNAVRSGDAAPALLARLGMTCCFRCMNTENLFPMCHDDGILAHDVYVCAPCTRELRFDVKRREIEQLRRFANYLDTKGEGVSAAQTRRRADHFQVLLEKEQSE